ncbi:MAG: cell division protein FtsZ [Pseudomonadota bacterium]
MAIHVSVPKSSKAPHPRIVVIGVGGAGGNAVDNMIKTGLEGVDFVVANTDAQALERSSAERKIQLGPELTGGLGAGARPDIGKQAAEEAIDEVMQHLQGANMLFVTCGMGGGTGTGATPVIASAARKENILTVGVVTKPFNFEGTKRMRMAEDGIEALKHHVDTMIVIPNQNLFCIATEKTTFADAFAMADQVLHYGVRGVTDLMMVPGHINLDFADIRTVMGEMGNAMMGTGEAEGENRARIAAESAISNPLLDDVTMRGARGVLINVTSGPDLTLFEVDEAAMRIREEIDPNANIYFGSTFEDKMDGKLRVTVVATGIEGEAQASHASGENRLQADHDRDQLHAKEDHEAYEAGIQQLGEPGLFDDHARADSDQDFDPSSLDDPEAGDDHPDEPPIMRPSITSLASRIAGADHKAGAEHHARAARAEHVAGKPDHAPKEETASDAATPHLVQAVETDHPGADQQDGATKITQAQAQRDDDQDDDPGPGNRQTGGGLLRRLTNAFTGSSSPSRSATPLATLSAIDGGRQKSAFDDDIAPQLHHSPHRDHASHVHVERELTEIPAFIRRQAK